MCTFGCAFAAEGDSAAGGGTDPVKLIGNFNSWLLSIFSALGVTIVIYGIYQIVTTWTSHDMMYMTAGRVLPDMIMIWLYALVLLPCAVLGFGLGCFRVGYLIGNSNKDKKITAPKPNDAVILT